MAKGKLSVGQPVYKKNKDWKNVSQKGKQLLLENLALPLPIAGGILIAVVVVPTYLKAAFFPDFDSTVFWAANAVLLVAFVFWLLLTTGLNYKKKTGKDFFKELEKETPGYVR